MSFRVVREPGARFHWGYEAYTEDPMELMARYYRDAYMQMRDEMCRAIFGA